MKTIFKYMAVSLAGFALAACNDLDTEPLGSTVTSDQKGSLWRTAIIP